MHPLCLKWKYLRKKSWTYREKNQFSLLCCKWIGRCGNEILTQLKLLRKSMYRVALDLCTLADSMETIFSFNSHFFWHRSSKRFVQNWLFSDKDLPKGLRKIGFILLSFEHPTINLTWRWEYLHSIFLSQNVIFKM